VRQVGEPGQQPVALGLDAVEFDLQLLDLLAPGLVGFEDRPGVEPLTFGPGNFVGGGVLLAFEALELRNEPAAVGLEPGQLLEFDGEVEPAAGVASAHRIEVVADESGIKHAPLSCVSYYGCPS
jgi:hypothetical protein